MRLFVFPLFVLAVCSTHSFASDDTSTGQWPHYAGDKASTKYSPLDQIDASNVADLKVAWRWNSAGNETEKEMGRRARQDAYKTTPLYVDGVLYCSTNYSQLAAIDPATGKTLWVFDPESYKAGRPGNYGYSHRGIEHWTDGKESRIVLTTGDRRLISVDAKTGKVDRKFGKKGSVDLAADIPRAERIGSYTNYAPTIVCRDTIVVGSIVADRVTLKEAPAGHVRGYDVRTGERKWIFHSVPQEGEYGNETWEDDSWKYSGHTNVWSSMSADEELGYVYLPFGCPTNDLYGGHRLGDNLFSTSLVCLNAETGERVWHYQVIHHDIWDYDIPAAPNLIDIVVDGKPIKAVAQVTKQAFLFVFNRETGEPIWPIEERPVPQSTLEGEKSSPTQPFPTWPKPFDTQGINENNLIDFTPELRKEALEILDDLVHGPLFTPPGEKHTLLVPGYAGGANWSGAGFDPETQTLYVPSRTLTLAVRMVKPDPARSNLNYVQDFGGDRWGPFVQGLPLLKPPYARITAYDMNTGEKKWIQPMGDGPRDNPAIAHLDLPPLGDMQLWRPLLTKTLLFAAKDFGDEPELRAMDKTTGEVVAQVPLPNSGVPQGGGLPITYMHDGKQYIVMSMGGGGKPAELVALALKD